MVELAWMWLRWQPDSALSNWFRARLGQPGSRIKKIMIVALARKLLVVLVALRQGWRHSGGGEDEDGIRRVFNFASILVNGWRSPQKTEDP
jgi:hypothetical protein